jgi:hypothetical protein
MYCFKLSHDDVQTPIHVGVHGAYLHRTFYVVQVVTLQMEGYLEV